MKETRIGRKSIYIVSPDADIDVGIACAGHREDFTHPHDAPFRTAQNTLGPHALEGMTLPFHRSFRFIPSWRLVHWAALGGLCLWLLTACADQQTREPVSEADAARFLEQATWGPNEASIQELQQKGFEDFLDEQYAAPASSLGTYSYMDPTPIVGCPASAPNRDLCVRDNYSPFPLQIRFFQNALTGSDQLRQRTAFALSQIFVVSAAKIYQPNALASYQELLSRHAFGNFRDILGAVTLSPAMGNYLDMVNNVRADPITGSNPNENFARELLQLFTVGVFKLNMDGTIQKDGAGRPVPTYDADTIKGFSRVFTGWTYPVRPGNTPQVMNLPYYTGSMVATPSNHDSDAKKLLDVVVLPPDQTPEDDLNGAIDNVFNHPNVGPFIGKQLIQQLVTSNPSPAYVNRVAGVFNNNGQGIRGDMRAIIKAILLDPEARGDAKTDPEFGKLREPVKFIAGIMRALNGRSDGVAPRMHSAAQGQPVYLAPSVFNFYPPNYPLQGTSLVSPVSAIYTATTVLARANFVYTLIYGNGGIAPDPTVAGAFGTKIDLVPLAALAHEPEKLMDLLDRVMMHKSMSGTMRRSIIKAVDAVPTSDALGRARVAIYLVATSPQYQVER
jgi:uncharacterized protein (DUF1800 family)